MNRRDFLRTGLVGAAGAIAVSSVAEELEDGDAWNNSADIEAEAGRAGWMMAAAGGLAALSAEDHANWAEQRLDESESDCDSLLRTAELLEADRDLALNIIRSQAEFANQAEFAKFEDDSGDEFDDEYYEQSIAELS